ncbi:MAG TPA: DUF58 domain-containing protein, partial [Novosphingobium sp.]|nr:DUF58 domain-containing protein [Novosphingobium sp.]
MARLCVVPTARAALLAALAAPLALVIAAASPGLWVVAPALGLVLLAIVLGDALLAGSLAEVQFSADADMEVGAQHAADVSVRLAGGRQGTVEVVLAGDPRLFPGGRAVAQLMDDDGAWRARLTIRPTRRGRGEITRLWLRWTGPLGLGARQASRALDREVRVWPDVAQARSPALQLFLRDAQFGMIARRMRGEGSQFEALAEYRQGMDRRRIDWKSSARHARLFAREYETERNTPVVFAFDCGQAMCEPVDGVPRIDRAVSAALATAWVALKGGDRVALFGFAERPLALSAFVAGSGSFRVLQQTASGFDYSPREANYTLAMASLASQLRRRSLVIVFGEFSDPTSAELMLESVGRLVRRHVVLFVTLADAELEPIALAEPTDGEVLARAVAADALLRQRALVLRRLRALGV